MTRKVQWTITVSQKQNLNNKNVWKKMNLLRESLKILISSGSSRLKIIQIPRQRIEPLTD